MIRTSVKPGMNTVSPGNKLQVFPGKKIHIEFFEDSRQSSYSTGLARGGQYQKKSVRNCCMDPGGLKETGFRMITEQQGQSKKRITQIIQGLFVFIPLNQMQSFWQSRKKHPAEFQADK